MSKKRGLGKGLDALIPSGSADLWGARPELAAQSGLVELAPEEIVPNPHQPRAPIDEAQLAELAASIKEHGLIQPVIVTRVGDSYQLIAGERRWRAAQQAGLERIPALVKETTAQEMLELALVENIQRADLNVLEEAAAYRQLMKEFGLTQEEVAQKVGKSRSAVANVVRLLGLPARIQAALLDGRVSEGHGRQLVRLPTVEAQEAGLATILKRSLSVRQTEELVDRLLGEKRVVKRRPASPEIRSVEEQLRQRLGTKVDVSHGRNGGRIVIHYYSDEELDSLLGLIGGDR